MEPIICLLSSPLSSNRSSLAKGLNSKWVELQCSRPEPCVWDDYIGNISFLWCHADSAVEKMPGIGSFRAVWACVTWLVASLHWNLIYKEYNKEKHIRSHHQYLEYIVFNDLPLWVFLYIYFLYPSNLKSLHSRSTQIIHVKVLKAKILFMVQLVPVLPWWWMRRGEAGRMYLWWWRRCGFCSIIACLWDGCGPENVYLFAKALTLALQQRREMHSQDVQRK